MPKNTTQKSPSFDEIIQSDRQKKQNELLASQILGKNKNKKERRASAPGSGAGTLGRAHVAKPGSLASRIAAPSKLKRSASASFRTTQPPSQPQHKTKVKTNPAPATVGSVRAREKPTRKKNQKEHPQQQCLLSLAQSSRDTKISPKPTNSGLSIKGASGPFVVVGSNFAPGTTAADIQSSLEPVTGPMLSCRVISHSPAVMAEITYAEKWSAESTVANFDNQRADGRLLTFKLSPIGDAAHVNTQNSFNNIREQADRDRRNRRAEPQVQNGSYGFGAEGQALDREYLNMELYSDQMMVDRQSQNNQSRRRRY